MNINDILTTIESGSVDSFLDSIGNACRRRQAQRIREHTQVNPDATSVFQIGAHVRIRQDCNPQYLRGRTGVVTGVLNKRVTIILDHDTGRGRFNDEFKCPPALLEVVS